MERQISRSKKSITSKSTLAGSKCANPELHPAESDQPTFCEALASKSCQDRGGCLESGRIIRTTTRYCRDCSPIMRRRKSAEWKRNKRRELGWRGYRDAYDPYYEEERLEKRRDYERCRRERKRAEKRQLPSSISSSVEILTGSSERDQKRSGYALQ